ncbi:MAG: hypothetical protein JWO26_3769, partial [Rhodospirillales bacterium]|nr:hypothetical protein [Rhodospirillales bacterium]
MTLCAYEVDCADLLDLADYAVCAAHGIDPRDLACAWEDLADRGQVPPSWVLTRRLIGQGVAGILVPSFANGARPRDVNAVFWRW